MFLIFLRFASKLDYYVDDKEGFERTPDYIILHTPKVNNNYASVYI